ncbi:MAG TPA: hypothetical protein VM533_13200 [Fimbriiglobus sp.]|jgi:hypothetical protein|nr:hypothetical protein [Fimbriiglobus sp.]
MKRYLIGVAVVMTGAVADVSASGPKGNGGGHSGGHGGSHHAGADKPTTAPFKHTTGGGFHHHHHHNSHHHNSHHHNWGGNIVGGHKPFVHGHVGGHNPFVHSHVGGHKFGTIHTAGKGYHLTHGKPFTGGFYYHGKGHHHWTYWGYSPKYGCNCYWCPSTRCYYYWCQPAGCYYPISYFASAPPYPAATQVQTEQPGGLPPGVPPLPE